MLRGTALPGKSETPHIPVCYHTGMIHDGAPTPATEPYPLFILGAPRSGTKLLRALLNNHPDVSLGSEGNFVPRLVRQFGAGADLARLEVQREVYAAFSRSEYVRQRAREGVGLSEEDLLGALEAYRAQGVPLEWGTVLELMLRPYGPRPQAPVFGDKSHGYISDVALVRSVFPRVRFIFLVRDPRDQALSARTAWGRHPLRSAHLWAGNARKAAEAGLAVAADTLTVRYEDLTGDPEGELRRVCAFLGVPYVAAMAHLQRPVEREKQGRQLKTVVTQQARYRGGLEPRLMRGVTAITLPYLQGYGYPDEGVTKERTLSPLRLRLLSFTDGLSTLRFHIRRKGLVTGSSYYLKRHLEARAGSQERPR